MSISGRLKKVVTNPRVFVSYTSDDRHFVQQLAQLLEAAGIRFWVDFLEIRVGDSIVQEVTRGLEESDTLVVVLSQASVRSRWVNEEINAGFMRMIEGKGVRLCPVLTQQCDIPILLRQRRYADFTKGFSHGLRELIEGIAPNHSLWQDLNNLNQEFKAIVAKVLLVPSETELYELLADLDILLTQALSRRYQIAVKREMDRPEMDRAPMTPDFYTMFGYLEFEGLCLRSEAWASLRDFRNQFVHRNPRPGREGILLDEDPKVVQRRTDMAEQRAEEVKRGIHELSTAMEILCEQSKPEGIRA